MDHSWGSAWGAASFWLFIAVAVWAGSWEKSRRNAEKHETLRRIIDKTGTVDEAKLKELFNARGTDWGSGAPGDGFRALRIVGAIIMALAAALACGFLIAGLMGVQSWEDNDLLYGFVVAGAAAVLGLGVFISSRFAEPPPDRGNGPAAR